MFHGFYDNFFNRKKFCLNAQSEIQILIGLYLSIIKLETYPIYENSYANTPLVWQLALRSLSKNCAVSKSTDFFFRQVGVANYLIKSSLNSNSLDGLSIWILDDQL